LIDEKWKTLNSELQWNADDIESCVAELKHVSNEHNFQKVCEVQERLRCSIHHREYLRRRHYIALGQRQEACDRVAAYSAALESAGVYPYLFPPSHLVYPEFPETYSHFWDKIKDCTHLLPRTKQVFQNLSTLSPNMWSVVVETKKKQTT
jgi:hypothetical protein